MRRIQSARLQGVILAALLVASQTSAWVHAAVVSHATCAEHGELIHAGAAAPETQDAAGAPAGAAVLANVPTASAHEHCGAGALLRFRELALAAPIAVALVPTLSSPRVRAGAPPLVRGADVYLVAPKTSPPGDAV